MKAVPVHQLMQKMWNTELAYESFSTLYVDTSCLVLSKLLYRCLQMQPLFVQYARQSKK